MFKAPFSFKGRIRRAEFGISMIICIIVGVVLIEINKLFYSDASTVIIFIFNISVVWFAWAQGAKRCHDRGNSGWFQIIPFYGLWMLFGDSEHGINEYGPNPKGMGNQEPLQEPPQEPPLDGW